MPVTAASLQTFYQTPLGRALAHDIAAGIRHYQTPHAETIIGFGYTEPYWSSFAAKARRRLSFLPSSMAGEQEANQADDNDSADSALVAILANEHRFPLPDNSADCILAVHALEFCPNAQAQMQEFRRILAPNGRLILAVPNRRGLWARTEQMPFGHGQPYSRSQLAELLDKNKLAFSDIREISYFLPNKHYNLPLLSRLYSKFAAHFIPYFGAVLMVEARKQLYKPILKPAANPLSAFIPGFTAPQPIARLKK